MCYHKKTCTYGWDCDPGDISTCVWSGPECNGTPTSCSAITKQSACEKAGCSWESGITGFTVTIDSPAYRDSLINATASASAVGGETVYFFYNWSINGIYKTTYGNYIGNEDGSPSTRSSFPCSTYGCNDGDRVAVKVTAWFSDSNSDIHTSEQTRTVVLSPMPNRPPSAPPAPVLLPASVYADGTVQCRNCPPTSPPVSDPDGDTVSISYQWYFNGAPQGYVPATSFSCSGVCSIGDTIQAQMMACDNRVPQLCSYSPLSNTVTVVDASAQPTPNYMILAIVIAFLMLSIAYMATYIFEMV